MKISANNFYINFQSQKRNQPVYAVDAYKNVQKFETRKNASNALGVNPSTISGILLGRLNRSGIYTFLSPEEVEKISSDGEIQIDTQKVQNAQYKIVPAIYAIDKDKNYIRFNSQIEASRTLGIATGNISRCIHSEAGKSQGFVFVSATEVEKVDENGNEVVDIAKIEKLANSLNQDSAIYVIDENGSFSRFDTPSDAAKATSIDEKSLEKGFNEFKKKIGKYTYIKAKNIEEKKLNGKYELEEDKLIALFIGNRYSLYSVDKQGNARFFETQSEASKMLGVSSYSITSCLKGVIKNVDGYTFAKPNQVLGINSHNQITFDSEKIDLLLADRFEK